MSAGPHLYKFTEAKHWALDPSHQVEFSYTLALLLYTVLYSIILKNTGLIKIFYAKQMFFFILFKYTEFLQMNK